MAESTTPRLGLRRWTDGADTPSRAEFDAGFASLEALAAIFVVDTLAARPAAGTIGRFYFASDTATLFFDTGAAWITVGGRDLPPAGTIRATVAAAAPAGWLLCHGQSLLRADYPALLASGGGAGAWPWGLVDALHYTLPDLRGRVLMGAVAGALGPVAMPTHLHDLTGAVTAHAGNTGNENADHTHAGNTAGKSTGGADHAHGVALSTGGATNPGGMDHVHAAQANLGQFTGPADHNLEHGHDFAGNTANGGVDHTHGFGTGGRVGNHSHDDGHGHLDTLAVAAGSALPVAAVNVIVKT